VDLKSYVFEKVSSEREGEREGEGRERERRMK